MELLGFYKALADANRLKIIGLLAQGQYAVEQIAEILGLRPSTVSHHLSKLLRAGLVSARPESYYNTYRLETGVLESMSQRLLAQETMPANMRIANKHFANTGFFIFLSSNNDYTVFIRSYFCFFDTI